jgi:hypothetical protein
LTVHPQDLSLRRQAALIAAGELDPGELLEATLARIEQRNPPLRAVVATFPEHSRAMSQAPPGFCGCPGDGHDMFSPRARLSQRHPPRARAPSASGAFGDCATRHGGRWRR